MKTLPPLAPLSQQSPSWAGFTLLEMVIALVLMGILAAYVAPKALDTSAVQLDAQAKVLASDLQRAQMLATSRGQTVLVCAAVSSYVLQLGGSCPTPLPSQTSSTQPVVVSLAPLASLVPPLPSLSYANNGQPNNAASFKLQASGGVATYTVSVAALSGLVSVSAP